VTVRLRSSTWFLLQAIGLSAVFSSGCAGSKSDPEGARTTYVHIDDVEDPGGVIDWRPDSGADDSTPGSWDTEAGIQCGNIQPMPRYLGGMWAPAALEQPYATFANVISQHAARLHTTAPLVNTWGATLAFDFAKQLPLEQTQPLHPGDMGDPASCTPPLGVERDSWTPALAVDLRAYRGVAFYARASPEAGTTAIFVKVHDRNTDRRGGECDPSVGSDRECYNAFGTRVVLGAEFRRYTVYFEDFEQEIGWGFRPPAAEPDLEHVYSLVFQVRTPGGPCDPPSVCPGGLPELTFDVWIDDLAFVER
jgi:hypothetical protein